MQIWKIFILALIVVITLVEYVFVYMDVAYGILLSLLVAIVIYVVVSIPKKETAATKAAESLALIPLYVLFTSSLPWFFIKQTYLLPAVYSIVLALCIWHVHERGISTKTLGLVKKKWKVCAAAGMIIGIPTGTIEYFVLKIPPALPSFQIEYLLRDILYMLLFISLGEELLFRGIIQTDLQKTFGNRTGLFLAAYLFGIMHLTWRSPLELLFAFSAGYILGYIYYRTGSLIGPIMLHAMNNILLVGILPYLFG